MALGFFRVGFEIVLRSVGGCPADGVFAQIHSVNQSLRSSILIRGKSEKFSGKLGFLKDIFEGWGYFV